MIFHQVVTLFLMSILKNKYHHVKNPRHPSAMFVTSTMLDAVGSSNELIHLDVDL